MRETQIDLSGGIEKLAKCVIEGSVWMDFAEVAQTHGIKRAIELLPRVEKLINQLISPIEEV